MIVVGMRFFFLGLFAGMKRLPIRLLKLGSVDNAGQSISIMGIAGAALIFCLFARRNVRHDFRFAPIAAVLPCHLYILFYSLKRYCATGASNTL